jgi:hypothetical protein
MWALGYDGSEPEMWGALKTAFAMSTPAPSVVLDGFESGTGRFTTSPAYSGTTKGISSASSIVWTNDISYEGGGSLKIVLMDDVASANDWVVRLLSGSGNPAANQAFSSSSHAGLWLRTSTAPASAQVALSVDNGTSGTLISARKNIINDGIWHQYEWDLAAPGWSVLAGADTALTAPSVTLDAVMFYAPNSPAPWTIQADAVFIESSEPMAITLSPDVAPVRYSFIRNYPNPFNPITTIEFNVARDGYTSVKVYDLLGREVAEIFSGVLRSGESHRVMFDGKNCPSGMYIACLRNNGTVQNQKLMLLK